MSLTLYAKLFASILDSSVWLEPLPTRIVWLTLLAAKDADGFARFACVENLAQRARVALPDAEVAVDRLEAPDLKSSNPAHEGRRIERVPGGWMVLNASFYDEIVRRDDERRATRERVRRHRERKSSDGPTPPAPDPAPLPRLFAVDAHHDAYLKCWTSARSPESFNAMLKTLHEPISGGAAYEWNIIGQALLELQSNGSPITANAIRAFCRKLTQPEPEQKGYQSKQERGRAALLRGLQRNGFTNGQPADNREVSRPIPRALPDARRDRPDGGSVGDGAGRSE